MSANPERPPRKQQQRSIRTKQKLLDAALEAFSERGYYVTPKYPRSAQRKNVTGAVEVSFTVSTNGTVTEISILRAEPEDTFNQAAMNAVAKWRFQPVIENGVAVEKRSAVRLAFDLK